MNTSLAQKCRASVKIAPFGCPRYGNLLTLYFRIEILPSSSPMIDYMFIYLGPLLLCLSCALQLLLGAPFLLQHPVAYVARSFELGRVFKFEWTVNFKFLGEDAFVSPVLSVILLILTVLTLTLFAAKWIRSVGTAGATDASCGDAARNGRCVDTDKQTGLEDSQRGGGGQPLLPQYVVKTLFTSNFIGVVFCRSLHYQVRTEAIPVVIGPLRLKDVARVY